MAEPTPSNVVTCLAITQNNEFLGHDIYYRRREIRSIELRIDIIESSPIPYVRYYPEY